MPRTFSIITLSVLFLLSIQLPAQADNATDALVVLTTVGYLIGAADGCKVAANESNALSGGMAIAIGNGKYGNVAEAHSLLNNARQHGVAAAVSKKVDCGKISNSVKQYVQELQK